MATDEAIVLAGGLGTRLRGVVDDVPKPLAPVAGRPFVAWLLDALAQQGMRRVVLATGYLGDRVEDTFGDRWSDVPLVYSRETEPLGTGGAIVLAMQHIAGDGCFVLNGDTWLELVLADLEAAVRQADARLGVALAEVPDIARYGAVHVENGYVTGFIEKGCAGPGFVNAGVYWMRRGLLDGHSPGTAFSFERKVLVPAVAHERVTGFRDTRDFIDIGIPEDFRRAQALFAQDEHEP